MKTLGIDVGGTFTDIVLADTTTGAVAIHKVSTTPHDPSDGVMQGILAICAANSVPLREISYVMHGTTIATISGAPDVEVLRSSTAGLSPLPD